MAKTRANRIVPSPSAGHAEKITPFLEPQIVFFFFFFFGLGFSGSGEMFTDIPVI
jgi:hypothetical protein